VFFVKQRNVAEKQHDQTAEPGCAASSVREAAPDERPEPQPTAAAKAVPVVLRGLGEKLTSDVGRDAAVDPVVEAANAAFARIGTHRRLHRKLFRRDWLPFCDGVYHVSLAAWERTGRRTRLDGSPDWDDDRVQDAFRELIRGLPWEHFFEGRRTLLSVLRRIGGERERFLRWYDAHDEAVRERVGNPETLWKKFAGEVLKPAPDKDDAAESDATTDKETATTTAARTDAERMADLVTEVATVHAFCVKLRESVKAGRSMLERGLVEELDALLERAP
jgi:hypothetical protein